MNFFSQNSFRVASLFFDLQARANYHFDGTEVITSSSFLRMKEQAPKTMDFCFLEKYYFFGACQVQSGYLPYWVLSLPIYDTCTMHANAQPRNMGRRESEVSVQRDFFLWPSKKKTLFLASSAARCQISFALSTF